MKHQIGDHALFGERLCRIINVSEIYGIEGYLIRIYLYDVDLEMATDETNLKPVPPDYDPNIIEKIEKKTCDCGEKSIKSLGEHSSWCSFNQLKGLPHVKIKLSS